MFDSMIEIIDNGTLLKLSFAAISGLIIGFERELKGKPLGLKTCLIVCLTACLLTIVSFQAALSFSEAYSRPMDAGRIPSYLISGVGFLGAGVILRKNNDAISGLTTAALVLASAGIGITIGAGFYMEALLGIIFMFLGVRIIPDVLHRFGPKKLNVVEIRAKLSIKKSTNLTNLLIEIRKKELIVTKVKVREEDDTIVLTCVVLARKKVYTTDVFYDLKSLLDVIKVEVESLR